MGAVRYLVAVGAALDCQDASGWTPLMLAARNGRHEVVEYLVRCGADTKKRSRYNHTVYSLGDKSKVLPAIERGLGARVAAAARRGGERVWTCSAATRSDDERRIADKHRFPVVSWSAYNVGVWLQEQGLGELAKQFEARGAARPLPCVALTSALRRSAAWTATS
jgi:hypothetical protein